jgi:deoxycytidylate deaminase
MMIQAGIKRLVYKDIYRDQGGIALLLQAKVDVQCYDYTQSNER